MSVSPTPQQPPDWSSDYFRDAHARPGGRREAGLVGHVPIVAVLLMVQGALEICFGLFGGAFLALVYLVPHEDFTSMRGLGIFLTILAMPAALCGVVRIVAGIFNLRFRRRGLGLVALGLGLFSLATGYCAPTAIALAVYGLIVYVNEPVIAAFEMADSGRTPAEIRAAFEPR
jgi:hypothetical protein